MKPGVMTIAPAMFPVSVSSFIPFPAFPYAHVVRERVDASKRTIHQIF